MYAGMDHGPLTPVFDCRAKEPVMSHGEIATWSRLLAPTGRMDEGDVLCIFHKSSNDNFRTRAAPCTEVLQIQQGRPRLLQVGRLSRAERREAGIAETVAYGSRRTNSAFHYVATRFNSTVLNRREMKDPVHCILPGGVITFPQCTESHYRHLFGQSWSSRYKNETQHASALARRPVFGHVALNKAVSNHAQLRQEVTMADLWHRFQTIWSALLPEDCACDLGAAPEIPASA